MHSSITPEEQAKIREQIRDLENQKSVLALKVYAEQVHDQRMSALNNVREYGTLTIRSLYILHGGALVALLSFAASLYGKSDEKNILIAISVAHGLRPAFYCFAAGLTLAGAISAIAYLNWLSVHETYQSPSHIYSLIAKGSSDHSSGWHDRFVRVTLYLAIVLAVLSLASFIGGAFFVAEALHVMGA